MEKLVPKKKIVLAEGEAVIAEILPQFLKPIGYDVTVVSDGQAALYSIRRELPHLIILDEDLELIDGFSLCQILKKDFLTSYIPIIILMEKRQIRKRLLEIQEGVDDYIFKPPDPIDLQIRLEMAFRRTEHQMHANSLTRLPGNKAIEHTSRLQLASDKPFSLMYLDIDNFKAFNDTYGYLRGDGVLLHTARILRDCVLRYGEREDFIGHVGGDDFVIITRPQKHEAIANAIIREFDRLIPFHYDSKDRETGYLIVKDRQNNVIHAPLMGISIAIVNNVHRKISSVIELTEIASEIKKHLKTLPGSKFLVNRRGHKKKSPETSSSVGVLPPSIGGDVSSLNKPLKKGALPLGQVLLNAKVIDHQQLNEALVEHWSSRQMIGETFVKMGLITPQDLKNHLDKTP